MQMALQLHPLFNGLLLNVINCFVTVVYRLLSRKRLNHSYTQKPVSSVCLTMSIWITPVFANSTWYFNSETLVDCRDTSNFPIRRVCENGISSFSRPE
jgi:hypothetical protein